MINKQKNTLITPSAWVVNPQDRGRKSIKNGKVYLKDSEEFQIELHNPLQECVLTDIKLNGNSISKSGLILKPGQRFYLDCFIDDKKKFIFNTYEVENNSESLNAINKNGSLEVYFYKESVTSIDNWNRKLNTIVINKYYPSYQPYWYTTPNIYFSNISNPIVTSTNTTYGTTYGTGNINLTNSIGTITSTPINSTIETGRVERGENSNQKFDEIEMDFDNYYISSVILELLPESRKPEELKNVKPKQTQIKNSDEVIELIKKLSDLHKNGILTDEEFSNKKSELLSKI